VLVSMSTTFYPQDDPPTDLIILTSDNVLFAVHDSVLRFKSQNSFGELLSGQESRSFAVPESSEVLNLVLYAFYDLDPAHYRPTLDHIASMLDAFSKYGLPLEPSLTKGKPIYNVICGLAFASPLEAYALVAKHNLDQLAVEISHQLHSTPLYDLTDELCLSMGPIYLRRLMFLHLGRTERLKMLLRESPRHEPTVQCDAVDQQHKLKTLWREKATTLCWDVSPSTPVSLLQATLSPVVEKLGCDECKTSTRERIRQIIVEWTMVKSTI